MTGVLSYRLTRRRLRPAILAIAVSSCWALAAAGQALSYVDIYWLLAAISLLMFLLCFFLAKNEPGKGGSVAVH